MAEVIAVLSGKGGTGKTSLCAGIATALALEGKQVLCIDCDVGLRNLDIALGLSDLGAISFLEVCRGDYPLDRATAHPVYPNLRFLTAPINCHADTIDRFAFARMLDLARTKFQYIFLDALPVSMPVSGWLPVHRIGRSWYPAQILPPSGMPAAAQKNWKRWGSLPG